MVMAQHLLAAAPEMLHAVLGQQVRSVHTLPAAGQHARIKVLTARRWSASSLSPVCDWPPCLAWACCRCRRRDEFWLCSSAARHASSQVHGVWAAGVLLGDQAAVRRCTGVQQGGPRSQSANCSPACLARHRSAAACAWHARAVGRQTVAGGAAAAAAAPGASEVCRHAAAPAARRHGPGKETEPSSLVAAVRAWLWPQPTFLQLQALQPGPELLRLGHVPRARPVRLARADRAGLPGPAQREQRLARGSRGWKGQMPATSTRMRSS